MISGNGHNCELGQQVNGLGTENRGNPWSPFVVGPKTEQSLRRLA